jgi:hypothetical protein
LIEHLLLYYFDNDTIVWILASGMDSSVEEFVDQAESLAVIAMRTAASNPDRPTVPAAAYCRHLQATASPNRLQQQLPVTRIPHMQ